MTNHENIICWCSRSAGYNVVQEIVIVCVSGLLIPIMFAPENPRFSGWKSPGRSGSPNSSFQLWLFFTWVVIGNDYLITNAMVWGLYGSYTIQGILTGVIIYKNNSNLILSNPLSPVSGDWSRCVQLIGNLQFLYLETVISFTQAHSSCDDNCCSFCQSPCIQHIFPMASNDLDE